MSADTAAREQAQVRRRMFVTVGTDHHPFERLIGWVEAFAARFEDWEVQVQHGRTRRPAAGHGFAFCDADRLEELFDWADVVVCHGGPATITEARRWGHHPLVVARDPGLGEHVDNHQQLFVRRLAASGLVEAVDSEDAFLAGVVVHAFLPRQRVNPDDVVPEGVFRVGRIAEDLVAEIGRRPRPA